ncbi:hypothetical protein T4D_9363 [Trichinella pseudospiralis]|uniref:Uncharacterized protein n=1 Tax=Trichinella pseudospiralis TaxID=6337 RepID=A0A0V1DRH2_TRIPS|nr:hypothetical protein T4D_9363 [Trichinella pseudospiralis]
MLIDILNVVVMVFLFEFYIDTNFLVDSGKTRVVM